MSHGPLPRHRPCPCRPSPGGFSLVELLAVLAIVAILLGLIVPSVGSLLRSRDLTTAADQVVALFGNARQEALTRNRAVEVRLFSFVDPETPGSGSRFRALQIFVETENAARPWQALGKLQKLPASVAFDSGSKLSPLIASLPPVAGTPDFILPGIGSSYSFVRFSFRADGSTSLDPTQKWFVTLAPARDPDKSENLPTDNWAMVQIFPLRGAIKAYRP